MNKYSNRIMQKIKGFIFVITTFLLSFCVNLCLIFYLCKVEFIGAIFFSIVISIFCTLVASLFRLLITEVE